MVTKVPAPPRQQIHQMAGGDERLTRAVEALFALAGDGSVDAINALLRRMTERESIGRPSTYDLEQRFADATRALRNGRLVFVSDVHDFPAPVAGVITLPDDTAYFVIENVDLLGARLVCGTNTSIFGTGTETSSLSSTGLAAALITSAYSLTFSNITLTSDLVFDLDAAADQAIDWSNVNMTNCAAVGRIANYSNMIFVVLGLINSAGLVFDGTIGTVGFSDTLFSGLAGETTITIAATAVITRRFRVRFSAIFTPTGGTGIYVDPLASISSENYVISTCSFSGPGTPIAGVQHYDNKARFTENTGIENTTSLGNLWAVGNVTPTPVTINVPTKALGTTTASPITERFTATDNRLTYTGAIDRRFRIDAWATLSAGSLDSMRILVAKNGSAILGPIGATTAGTGGRASDVSTSVVLTLSTSDYVEIFVSNESSGTSIVAENLNLVVGIL